MGKIKNYCNGEANKVSYKYYYLNKVIRYLCYYLFRIHECLMGIQQKQLDELRLWLTQTEDRISRLSQSAKMDVDSLRTQLDEHSALRADLRKQQVSVDSLSNLVVVIDENTFPDSGEYYF